MRTRAPSSIASARTYAGFPVIVGGRAIGTPSRLFTGDVTLRESQLELLRVLGRAAAVEEERQRAIEDRVLGLAQLEQAMERTVGTLSGAVSSAIPTPPATRSASASWPWPSARSSAWPATTFGSCASRPRSTTSAR